MITFREAVEVGLILAIILSYLKKLGRKDLVKHVYYGALLGALLSVLLAVGLPRLYGPEVAAAAGAPMSALAFFAAILVLAFMMKRYMNLGMAPLVMVFAALTLMFLGLYGYAQTGAPETLEAGALFSATLILTYVTYWMASVAYKLKERITSKIDLSVTTGKVLGVLTLTAAAVLREGAEVALLLYAAILIAPIDTAAGALLGILAASVLAYVYIARSSRLNWRKFFLYTSLLLITFSSGIFKIGLEDLVAVGLLPTVGEPVYKAATFLSEEGVMGGLLYVFIGYTAAPPLLPVVIQIVYLAFALKLITSVYHVSFFKRSVR